MSQENVELVYRATDAFNRRDIDAFLALSEPDVEFIPRIAELEGGGSYRATTVSGAGGRTSSASSPTSGWRSTRYETLET